MDELKISFKSRRYNRYSLDQYFTKPKNFDRPSTLHDKTKSNAAAQEPLFTTCNKVTPNIKRVIDKCWSILSENTKLCKIFDKK